MKKSIPKIGEREGNIKKGIYGTGSGNSRSPLLVKKTMKGNLKRLKQGRPSQYLIRNKVFFDQLI